MNGRLQARGRGPLASGLLLAVTIAMAVGTATAFDNDEDGLQDDYEDLLLQRHAPVMLLHPDEEYLPANVDWYLQKSRLRFHHDSKCDDYQIMNNPEQFELNIWTHPRSAPSGTYSTRASIRTTSNARGSTSMRTKPSSCRCSTTITTREQATRASGKSTDTSTPICTVA